MSNETDAGMGSVLILSMDKKCVVLAGSFVLINMVIKRDHK